MLVCLMGRKREREAVITLVPKVTGTAAVAGGQVCPSRLTPCPRGASSVSACKVLSPCV